MERDEADGVAVHLAGGRAHLDHDGYERFKRFEQLARLPVHIGNDAAGAAERIADDVERHLAAAPEEPGKAHRRDLRPEGPERAGPLERLVARFHDLVEGFLDRRYAEGDERCRGKAAVHLQDVRHRGEGPERRQRAHDAREILGEEVVGRVLDEVVVLVGHHVLTLDGLVAAVPGHAVVRPLVELVIEDLVHLARRRHPHADVGVRLEVLHILGERLVEHLVVVHGVVDRLAAVDRRIEPDHRHHRYLVRLFLQLDDVDDPLRPGLVVLLGLGTGERHALGCQQLGEHRLASLVGRHL